MPNNLPRRIFIGGLAGLAGAAVLEGRAAQTSNAALTTGRIDVHHHFWPPAYVSIARENNVSAQPANGWTVERSLEEMDRAGAATALTSISAPGLWFGDRDVSRRMARESNEYAARLVRDYPGRFGMFASLPLPDIDGTLREIEYAMDTLNADGICMHTSYQDRATGMEDRFLGHSMFAPVHEELHRRRALVYTHPLEADCCRNIVPEIGANAIEFGTNTTRTIASLIFTGTTTRFPDIRWIFSHAGGTMPFLIERFLAGTSAEIVPGIVTKGQGNTPPQNVPNGVLHELKKMYYDTAQSSNPIAMRALRTLVPVSQIVFGTDYPYRTMVEHVDGLTNCGVFDQEELRAIGRDNAVQLLPYLENRR